MRDSDFAMARDASSYQEKERGEGWWVDFGDDRIGKRFGSEVEGILRDLKGGEGVGVKGERASTAGM